ncbi:unnamed protein product [Periconia digitata]|uniref:Uncharacterized protein n=1 Tax=Periconia digitata TaxID=1303443 RepID=A0A9W4UQ28_9PLEO|nr:unnamed protein product [Periconia digitata]
MTAPKYKPLTLTPINFSLTEGTSIPAPLDSPPNTPRPPTPGKGPLSSHPTPSSAFFPQHRGSSTEKSSPDASADSSLQQTGSNENASVRPPTSPTGSKRPGSVRKFLGLRPLSSHESFTSERPGSPATLNSQPGLTRKKSTSWFGKRKSSFISGPIPEGNERKAPYTNGASSTNAAQAQPAQKKGPPPPALPELKSFGVSEDTFSMGADDLFKNIK